MAGAIRPPSLAAAVLGLALLSGCGRSPPTRFFTLDPVTPEKAPQTLAGPALRVDRVTIPAVLDRPELVREYAADQLKVDDFSHWGAPLGELMHTTLIEDLTARLPSGQVLPTDAATNAGAGDLTVEITAIHEGAGGLVADIDWTIAQRRPGPNAQAQTIRTSRHERIEAPLDGPSQQAFAAALSRLVGALADRIAAALPATN